VKFLSWSDETSASPQAAGKDKSKQTSNRLKAYIVFISSNSAHIDKD